jgi:hypothetical protein
MNELDGSELEADRRRNGARRTGVQIPDTLIEQEISPFYYISNLTDVILDLYRTFYNRLSFDPTELRFVNPRTNRVERYFSHPSTAKWWQEAFNYAQSLHPGKKIRMLATVLYGDATLADDKSKTHHPLYMSLANLDLKTFVSLEAKEIVALLPKFDGLAEVTKNTAARYRTALFQSCLSRFTSPFETIHREVFLFR